MPATEHEQLLRAAGLRVTRPRLAVLDTVAARPHADTEQVLAGVRADLGRVSHQAVYDVLRALTEARLVRRIQPAGSVARYETRVGDDHHHVVCRSCGSIADVETTVGRAECLRAPEEHDFAVGEVEVVFWGTCSACADPAGPPHP